MKIIVLKDGKKKTVTNKHARWLNHYGLVESEQPYKKKEEKAKLETKEEKVETKKTK